jgi:UPF0755 protein
VRLVKVLITFAVMAVFVLVIGAGFLFIVSGGNPVGFVRDSLIRFELAGRQDELESPMGVDATPIRFTINSGEAPVVVARNLADLSLISDAGLFVDYVRVNGLDVQLEAGTYFLNQTQTIPDIALALTDSRASQITFRVPEGSRIEEVADLIDGNGLFAFSGDDFLQVVSAEAVIPASFQQAMQIPAGMSLEGYLLPDTYILPPTIDALGLRDTLLEAFVDTVGQQMLVDASVQGLTMHQAVTFASIIEREAVWEDEHPLISSVYRNRYDIGMRLEADPTVQYALNGARGSWWPRITQADYRNVVSPYNTYVSDGLPPHPIANPGISAIRAAVYPAESDYYFFRARCDGSNYHNFATTYDEHLANGC